MVLFLIPVIVWVEYSYQLVAMIGLILISSMALGKFVLFAAMGQVFALRWEETGLAAIIIQFCTLTCLSLDLLKPLGHRI